MSCCSNGGGEDFDDKPELDKDSLGEGGCMKFEKKNTQTINGY